MVREQRPAIAGSAFLFGLAGIALLWFVGCLYGVLRQVEHEPGHRSLVAFAAGSLWALLYMLNGILLDSGRSFAAWEGDAEGARIVLGLASGWTFTVPALLLPAVLVGATALVAHQARALPRWLEWGGGTVAGLLVAGSGLTVVGQPFPVLPLGMLLLLAWVVATGAALLRPPGWTAAAGGRTGAEA